jgi:AraC-like DNA-binding protein
MVRMAPTMALPALLREKGVDPVPLLAEFGLTQAQFEEPDYTLSFDTRSRLLARCAEATRCPHFGLLLGQRGGMASFGMIGYLMQSAPDVRTAVHLAVRYFPLHNPNSTATLVERGRVVALRHTILMPVTEGREQVLGLSLGLMVNVMRGLCGHSWRAKEVRLAHARPRSVAPYAALVQAPVIFDTRDTAVVSLAHWLDRPLPTADPMLHILMRHRVADLESQAGEGVGSQLRRILPSLIDSRRASADEAATSLGLGVRTLNRRLAREGTSFARLRDETFHSIASQLLRGTRLPAGKIAEKLGYANAGAFTCAFRRWSGMTPTQWRANGTIAPVWSLAPGPL